MRTGPYVEVAGRAQCCFAGIALEARLPADGVVAVAAPAVQHLTVGAMAEPAVGTCVSDLACHAVVENNDKEC